MGPKINGYSIAELVSSAVDRQVEKKLGDYNNLLTGALSRIASLEEELAQSRQHSNNSSTIPNSNPQSVSLRSESSDVCRHWLRNRCTWNNCRFRHGAGGATSTSSLSDPNAKDLEEVVTKEKVEKSVQVGFSHELSSSSSSTCTIPLPCSDLPSRPNYVAGVLQPELVGAALSNNIVMSVLGEVLSSAVTSAKYVPAVATVRWSSPITGPCTPVSEEEKWLEDMVVAINKLEAKYSAKYKPIEEGGVVHSAQVAIPRIDFSKVKPHLHKKLPQPSKIRVQGCSPDPDTYQHHLECPRCSWRKGESSFDVCESPFGYLPGFVTSSGVVAVPKDPIGGYVYAGGYGSASQWQLHAEDIYI